MLHNKTPEVGAVAHALLFEGATYVWADAMQGVHESPTTLPVDSLAVRAMVLHRSVTRDGIEQPMERNRSYHNLVAADIPVESLDRRDDGSARLHAYTTNDLERLDAFARCRGKRVLTTLEEYPLPTLAQLDPHGLPPIVANLYRSGAGKSETHIQHLLQGLAAGTIARVTVDADASHDTYVELGVSPDDITVIHNGIDTDVFKPSPENRARVREELEIPMDAPTILFIGRDSPEKDVPLFLRSAREYLSLEPSGHIIMAGAGLDLNNPNIEQLVDAIFGDANNLKQHLYLLGPRSDFAAMYNAGDVLALTSATESRPLCISEAQASGLGVAVSTAVGDAPSMVGTYGYITGRDPVEIAGRWVEAYKRREEIGFPLERRDSLGLPRMIRKYHAVLKEILAA